VSADDQKSSSATFKCISSITAVRLKVEQNQLVAICD